MYVCTYAYDTPNIYIYGFGHPPCIWFWFTPILIDILPTTCPHTHLDPFLATIAVFALQHIHM